jgi:hypothetical protein
MEFAACASISTPWPNPPERHLSFDTRATARGTRLPAGRLHRLLNTITARQIRRSGQIAGFDCLVRITVGSRSGLERTNPVGWFPGPDNSRLIVAAIAWGKYLEAPAGGHDVHLSHSGWLMSTVLDWLSDH